LVCAVVAAAGCGKKNNCDGWAVMQEKCTGEKFDKDHEIEVCSSLETGNGSDVAYYKRTHDCAAETDDCAAFARCLDTAAAQKLGAPAAEASEATGITVAVLEATTKVVNISDDCGAQIPRVQGVLKSFEPRLARLSELLRNQAVHLAVARSTRFDRGYSALKKGTSCGEVLRVVGHAIDESP
jgi:hypothetical protein